MPRRKHTIPRGFVKNPKALDVVFALGGLQSGDEVVMGPHPGTNPHFFYLVARLTAPDSLYPPNQYWQYEVLRAPNWPKKGAVSYSTRSITHFQRERIVAWRRPTKKEEA